MSNWNAEGLSQEDLLLKDECILLDFNDKIIGHSNKKTSHIFSLENPRGLLHRAFSVFLFNNDGKLLLQQRSFNKITFPGVWTNTCCSHPLYGFADNEVDDNDNGVASNIDGVISAAIRKLNHELGIDVSSISRNQFKFLTRLHYWAADVVTHGPTSPWGENEIDYILFIKTNVEVIPNPEEVSAYKYVNLEELQSMMNNSSLLWSPWFRILAENFLVHWWKDLDVTLTTDKFVDRNTIHRFDPTEAHMGGAGNALKWLGQAKGLSSEVIGNANLKQGAYGKVIIHKHSKLDQFLRIDELFAGVWLVLGGGNMSNKVRITDENVKFCDDMLGKVSRSFASVIRQLPSGLCLDILIFYLALRALDTIEDDMKAFQGRENVKIDYLNTFYQDGLITEGWSLDGVGEGDEKVLLQQYYRVVSVFKSLPSSSQDVIQDITKRMGQGMASFVQRDLKQGTITIEDYNLYCHFVAGLVGEGLSRLFSSTGHESIEVANVSKTLANTMGLFLQKTNIIRDYLEDFVDGRAFWPQEIWKLYTDDNDLGSFTKPDNIKKSLHCLNHLIVNALQCVPECLDYMDLLKTEEIFRFCAIPQVMAIATLHDLYNNPKVFTGVVKIRKGLAAKLILDTTTIEGLHKWFNYLSKELLKKVPSNDPNSREMIQICEKIIVRTNTNAQKAIILDSVNTLNIITPISLLYSGYYLFSKSSLINNRFIFQIKSLVSFYDHFNVALFAGSALFLFGYQLVYATSKPSLRKAKY